MEQFGQLYVVVYERWYNQNVKSRRCEILPSLDDALERARVLIHLDEYKLLAVTHRTTWIEGEGLELLK